jgi:hypothetical protein
VAYRISDATGRVVAEGTYVASGQVFPLSLRGLVAGAYVCELVSTDGEKEVLHLVVQGQ